MCGVVGGIGLGNGARPPRSRSEAVARTVLENKRRDVVAEQRKLEEARAQREEVLGNRAPRPWSGGGAVGREGGLFSPFGPRGVKAHCSREVI